MVAKCSTGTTCNVTRVGVNKHFRVSTMPPKQHSEWLIALNKTGVIVKASFWLGREAPQGALLITRDDQPHRELIVHWYCNKPSKELESNISLIIMDWLLDGKLG